MKHPVIKRIAFICGLAAWVGNAQAQSAYRGPMFDRTKTPFSGFTFSDISAGEIGIARTAGDAAGDVINIRFKGAPCDGKSHLLSTLFPDLPTAAKVYGAAASTLNMEADAAGIQAAINEARGNGSGAQNQGAGFIFGQTGRITGGSGVCITGLTRIDDTQVKSATFTIDLPDMQIISSVQSDAAWDMSGAVGNNIAALNILGAYANFTASISGTTMTVSAVNKGTLALGAQVSTNQPNPVAAATTIVAQLTGAPGGVGTYTVSNSQTLASETLVTLGPNECVLMGRTSSQFGSTENTIHGLHCTGSFALDDIVSNSSENMTIEAPYLENSAPNAGVIAADGLEHFEQCSTVPGVSCPPFNQQQSFNHFVVHNGHLFAHGANDWCIWEGQAQSHDYDGGYCHNDGPGDTAGIIAYFGQGAVSRGNRYAMHFETNTLGTVLRITGAAKPVFSRLQLIDHGPFQSGSLVASTSEVTTVKMWGSYLAADQLQGSAATWWDNPVLYTVSGTLYSEDGVGFALPGSFSGQACTPVCVPYPATQIPSILNVSQVTNLGALDEIDVTNSGAFARSAGNLPTITISAPPPGTGTQATAIATAWTINAPGSIGTPGSGYPASEVVTDASDTCVGSGASQPTWTVTSVNGVPSSIKIKSRGFCPGNSWSNAGPISTTALTGTGLTIAGTNLGIPQGINSTAIVGAGSYPIGTAIAVSFGGSALPANLPAATAKASGNLQLGAGGNSLTYNSAGIFTTGPFAGSAASGGTGFQQSLTSPYATGQVLTYGAIVDNAAGDVYQVVNIGCTTADPAGPTVLSGTQTTTDGCQYVFLQAGLLFDEEVISDEGATDTLPRCFAVIGSPNQDACLYATLGSPNGLLTAPAGSLALDTGDMVACVNQDGGTTWGCLTTPAPLPASGTWTPVLTAATPGDIAFSNVTAQGDYDRIELAAGCVVHTSWTWTGTVTYTNASGNLQVTGLPYQRLGNGLPDEIGPAGQITGVTFPASQIAWEIMPGTKLLQLRGFKSGSGVGVATIGNAIASGSTVTIGGSGSYRGQGC